MLDKETLKLAAIDRPLRQTVIERENRALAAYYGGEMLDIVSPSSSIDSLTTSPTKQLNSPYIPRYSSQEDDAKYRWRVKLTIDNYQNYPMQIIAKYQEGINRGGPVTRAAKNPKLAEFLEKRFPRFMEGKFVPFYILLDEIFVQTSYPPAKGKILTKEDEDTLQGAPYQVLVFPHVVKNFSCDRHGNLEWISLQYKEGEVEVYDSVDRMIIRKTKDTDGWGVVDRQPHGFTRVPIQRFCWREHYGCGGHPKPGVSRMTHVINLCFGALTFISSLVEGAHVHARFKLVVDSETKKQIQKEGFGNTTVIEAKGSGVGESQPLQPYYLTTPTTEIDILDKIVHERKPQEIFIAARLKNPANVSVESGVAKFIDLIPEEGVLYDIAVDLERIEHELVEILAADGPLKDDAFEIKYPKRFSVQPVIDQQQATEPDEDDAQGMEDSTNADGQSKAMPSTTANDVNKASKGKVKKAGPSNTSKAKTEDNQRGISRKGQVAA